MTPKITVDKNYVIIDGHQIPRTHLCSQDQWIKFWAKVAPKKPDTGETK